MCWLNHKDVLMKSCHMYYLNVLNSIIALHAYMHTLFRCKLIVYFSLYTIFSVPIKIGSDHLLPFKIHECFQHLSLTTVFNKCLTLPPCSLLPQVFFFQSQSYNHLDHFLSLSALTKVFVQFSQAVYFLTHPRRLKDISTFILSLKSPLLRFC